MARRINIPGSCREVVRQAPLEVTLAAPANSEVVKQAISQKLPESCSEAVRKMPKRCAGAEVQRKLGDVWPTGLRRNWRSVHQARPKVAELGLRVLEPCRPNTTKRDIDLEARQSARGPARSDAPHPTSRGMFCTSAVPPCPWLCRPAPRHRNLSCSLGRYFRTTLPPVFGQPPSGTPIGLRWKRSNPNFSPGDAVLELGD